MSNNFVSQPLSVPNQQIGQLESISSELDTSIQNKMMGPSSNNAASQQFPSSNEQVRMLESLPRNLEPLKLSMAIKHTGQVESKTNDFGSQRFLIANKQLGGMEAMMNYPGSQQVSISNKRKASIEPIPSDLAHQRMAMPNKRVMQVEHRPWLQQLSSPSTKMVQMQSISNIPGLQHLPPVNKRVVQIETILNKNGPPQLLTSKNQTTQMQPSPKVQTELFGPVRSRLKESLATALALVTQQQDKPSKLGNNASEAATSPGNNKENSPSAESASTASEAPNPVSEKPIETLATDEDFSVHDLDVSHATFTKENTGDSTQTWKCEGQEFQLNPALPEDDVSFSDNLFVKDDLLQGNGLSWAIDVDMEVTEKKEVPDENKQRLDHDEVGRDEEQKAQSPEIVASKIEAELFKLFGGVNKKYKEKGRSLLFNLKDRNNPELREKVMSNKIPPERLCAMTAEELASKELSEWRIAKAEELAQMVVLPDDIDMRRLVKKTHKGEFQVEFEQDDSVSVEVSAGASSLPSIRPKPKKKSKPPSKPDKTKDDMSRAHEKNNADDQDVDCSLTILPNEETDLMQGLMVDDVLKDADFLPPIVSLDEFMESLDSEPPFENLPVDAGKTTPTSDKNHLEVGSESKTSDSSLKKPVDNSTDKPGSSADAKVTTADATLQSSDSHIRSATPPGRTSHGEYVWEGMLQLNPSATVTVIGFFRSGEKTSTKEWPSFLEIKGRVRLDAFEKFLQELPMSRSRAVMVTHFVLKEGSAESDRTNISEVTESYLSEERVGFSEPSPGVELYLCPPNLKTLEMFRKHLTKDHTESLNAATSISTNNGLIGVVVWRRAAQLTSTTISPNSTSHHRHSLKKQHSTTTSRRHQQEKVVNMNVNYTSKPLIHRTSGSVRQVPPDNQDDDDDDVPPGFGPVGIRDEDDLPEFNFSSGSNPPPVTNRHSNRVPTQGQGMTTYNNPHLQNPSLPVHQMRDLIHKYGQPGINNTSSRNFQDTRGFGAAMQQWKNNDDDDDDIPEWQPQGREQLKPTLLPPPPPAAAHNYQQQQMLLRPHMVNQQQHVGVLAHATHQPMLMQSNQSPMSNNTMQHTQNVSHLGQQQSTWAAPPFSPHGYPPSLHPSGGGQFYGSPRLAVGQLGTDSRRDVPRSRGI